MTDDAAAPEDLVGSFVRGGGGGVLSSLYSECVDGGDGEDRGDDRCDRDRTWAVSYQGAAGDLGP